MSNATAIEWADRLKNLPPYLFVEIDRAKRAAIKEGRDVINLGIGDPDYGTPKHIIDALKSSIDNPDYHHYALDAGMGELRSEIAKWFKARFTVDFNPDTEIYPLIGSKEGIAHFPLGVVNPGDKVLLTDPAYPAYRPTIQFAGGEIINIPLIEEAGWLPKMEDIKAHPDAKMLVLNYPNNPTAAVATKEFYQELVAFAREAGMIILSDMAYSEVYYDGCKPLSIFEVDGAMDVAIEFHSLSKTYYMTGWRIGWACGSETLVGALGKVKSNYDSGIFTPIQVAGIAALQSPESVTEEMRALYQKRRDVLVDGLHSIGWDVASPKAAFYVFTKIPKGFSDSMSTAKAFLDKADIVATPGNGFGPGGEGYIRMALTVEEDRLKEAVQRLAKVL